MLNAVLDYIHSRGLLGHLSFFDFVLTQYIKKFDQIAFIQIGANDGKNFDPIYNFVTRNYQHISGIVLEPIKEYFEELKKTYQHYPNILPVNFAIHNSEKEMIMYRADPKKQLPLWAKGIGSFSKKHHELSSISSKDVVSEKVSCISIKELIEQYKMTKVDLLQIDAEGYDAEIIFGLDFEKIQPRIINFEHGLSSGITDKKNFSQIVEILHNNGYELWMGKYDTTAYKRDLLGYIANF